MKKIYSQKVSQMSLFKSFDFIAPKLHVEYPELSASDIIKCEVYVNELNLLHNAKLIINDDKRKALIIKDEMVGFIQKRSDQITVHFKDGTHDNISQSVSLKKLFDHYNIFSISDNDCKFNFDGVVRLVADGSNA